MEIPRQLLKNRNRSANSTFMFPGSSFGPEVHTNTYGPGEYNFETSELRNVIIKTIPKGTLLFTYFQPARLNPRTKFDEIATYLNAFSCANLEFNREINEYEICISKNEPALKYFYGVPFIGNGVAHNGNDYRNMVVCVTKNDLRVAYGKSGTYIDDRTFTHKNKVVYDPRHIVPCSELEGGCRSGKEDDACLVPEFARTFAVDGIEQISAQDCLTAFHTTTGEFTTLSPELNNLFTQFGKLVEKLRNDLQKKEENAARLPELQQREKDLIAELVILDTKQKEINETYISLQPKLIQLYEKYKLSREEVAKKEKELNRNLGSYENIKPITNAQNKENWNSIMAKSNEIDTIDKLVLEKERELFNVQYTIKIIEKLEETRAEYNKVKNLLNMLLLQFDTDHHKETSYYGFSEIVLNTYGRFGYMDSIFLPESNPLYTQISKDEIQQTLTIKPENLDEFLRVFIYPKTIVEPIAFVNDTYVGLPPPLIPDTFPNLVKGDTSYTQGIPLEKTGHFINSFDLYKDCMDFLLNKYKINGEHVPRIVYDTRTNLFQIKQFTYSATPFNIPFYEGKDYSPDYSRFKVPTGDYFQLDIAKWNETTNTAQLSSDLLREAATYKYFNILAGLLNFPAQMSFTISKYSNLDRPVLLGPFFTKLRHPTLPLTEQLARDIPNELTKAFGDRFEIPTTDFRSISQDPTFLEKAANVKVIGRYWFPFPPNQKAPPNQPPVSPSTTLYTILGVPRNASLEAIKKAYKKLALETHPNKGGNQERFKSISAAYEILGNAEKRAQYDVKLPSLSMSLGALKNTRRGGSTKTHKKSKRIAKKQTRAKRK